MNVEALLPYFIPLPVTENCSEYIGLASHSQYLTKEANLDRLVRGNDRAAEKKYLMAAELMNDEAMMNLATLYEEQEKPRELVEKYYKLSLSTNPCSVVMYNLADYYGKIKDYENMTKYFDMAINNSNDEESFYELVKYYYRIKDEANMKKYYLMFAHHFQNTQTRRLDLFMKLEEKTNILLLVKFLDSVLEENNEIYKESAKITLKEFVSENKKVIIYRNKIALFKKLNHIVECGICYETKLHIDLKCAHCVCTDCYIYLKSKPCPFCRL
jgi:tetratricopeptide (TPR) repeat protein